MAFDFKAATPDTTFPSGGYLMGGDSQADADPRLYDASAYRNYLVSTASAWTARQTFAPNATNSGFNLVPTAGDPSTPENGDIWYNSTSAKFRKRENGATSDLVTATNPAGSGSELQYRSSGTAFGALTGSSVSGANVTLGGSIATGADTRSTFTHGATNSGLRFVPATGDPSTPLDGDVWYNSSTAKLRKRENGATSDLAPLTNPAGSGTELQYRSSGTAFGALTGSSVSGANLALGGTLTIPGTGGSSDRLGLNTVASNTVSVAIGHSATSSGFTGVAIGYLSEATGGYTVAFGTSSTAPGSQSTAVGYQANGGGTESAALGLSAKANYDYCTAVGARCTAGVLATTKAYATAIGYQASATNTNATAICPNSSVTGDSGTAIGPSSSVTALNGTAIGPSAACTHSGSMALGPSAATTAANQAKFAGAITQMVPGSDNTCTLGTGSLRWSEVFAANATINTSDVRWKHVLQASDGYDIRAIARALIDGVTPILYKVKDSNFALVDDGFDEVTEQVQETRTVAKENRTITIEDGKAVQRVEMVNVEEPIYDAIPVSDKNGVAITIVDKDGVATALTHPVPRMRTVTKQVPRFRKQPHEGSRVHLGFLAQDVKAAIDAVGINCAMWGLEDKNDPNSRQWLRPSEMMPAAWFMIQELKHQLTEAQAKIAALEAKVNI